MPRVGAPAAPGRDVTPLQRVEHVVHFVGHLFERGHEHAGCEAQRLDHAGMGRADHPRHDVVDRALLKAGLLECDEQLSCHRLHPLDDVSVCAARRARDVACTIEASAGVVQEGL